MTQCPCDEITEWVPNIPAGLEALPRQPWSFPEVRENLLRKVGSTVPGWLARDAQDLGVMWLEMWAYVSDVLAFYDERIANESYIRTAQRRPSLRRHVELLGYLPKPGIAGSVVVALEAEGRRPIEIAERTGFRSEAFDKESPQVFELLASATIDPLCNRWEITALKKNALPDHPPTHATSPSASPSVPAGTTGYFVFETDNFSLAKDRLALFAGSGIKGGAAVTRVTELKPFEGRDGKSYVEVHVSPAIAIRPGAKPENVTVSIPTLSGRICGFSVLREWNENAGKGNWVRKYEFLPKLGNNSTTQGYLYLDAIFRQLAKGAAMIVANAANNSLKFAEVQSLEERLVFIDANNPNTKIPVTYVTFKSALEDPLVHNAEELTFHFAFVDGGKVTTVPTLEVAESDLVHGVTLEGIVEAPLSGQGVRNGRVIEQTFLLQDKYQTGAYVRGSLTFDETGRALFKLTESLNGPLPTLHAPISVFGNVVKAFRGESVLGEVLGSGDPRVLNQSFQLGKKPLTYLDGTSHDGLGVSSLKVSVNGVLWTEVRSFYGQGPEAQVYIVRHDDEQNTFVIFGDGVRGARLESGVDNVRADYRYGSGEAAPPAGAVNQIARPAEGLARVRGPIPGYAGRNPDDPALLRTTAGKSVQLLGRAVGLRDFECVARLCTGVVAASAEFSWIKTQGQAGVQLYFIGAALASEVKSRLYEYAEPNLTIAVTQARAIDCRLHLTVAIDDKWDKAGVVREITKILRDSEQGILAPKNASIGGPFWISRLYEAVLSVKGARAVTGGNLYMGPNQLDLPLQGHDNFCAESGTYFQFAGDQALEITPTLSSL